MQEYILSSSNMYPVYYSSSVSTCVYTGKFMTHEMGISLPSPLYIIANYSILCSYSLNPKMVSIVVYIPNVYVQLRSYNMHFTYAA